MCRLPPPYYHGGCRYSAKASAYSGKKGTGAKGGGKKPSPLEPFDPSSHAEKEKADAVSMWIVIFFGLSVALLMRFYMMPGMDGTKQILWLLPLLMISLIRPIHQALVPSRFFELYTTGNWVRSSFLYIFTWLPCHLRWSTLLSRYRCTPPCWSNRYCN